MKKIERILAMIVLLLENETLSTTQLASRFQVSKRTIFRDMETIEGAGFPIVSVTGRNGGFSLLNSFKLRTLTYSTEEKQDILDALETKDELFGLTEAHQQSLIKGKIGLLQLEADKQSASLSFKSPTVHRPEIERMIQSKMAIVENALKHNYKLMISYIGNSGELTKRIIHPYELALLNGSWYVHAYCEAKTDFRYFKLTRIRNLEIVERSFERKEAVSKQWLESEAVQVTLRFKKEDLGKLYDYYTEEEIQVKEDDILVSFTSKNQYTILTLLLVFGNEVQVVEPASLREQHQATIKKLAETYKD